MPDTGLLHRLLNNLIARKRRQRIRALLNTVDIRELTWIPPVTSPLHYQGTPVRLAMDRVIGPRTLAFGHWHDAHCQQARQHLRPGQLYHLVDVGANAGLVSRQLLATPGLHFEGADCFEPDPHNYAMLQNNLAPFPGIRLHPEALSDADGEADIFRSSRNAGDISLSPDAALKARKDLFSQRIRLLSAHREGEQILASVNEHTRLVWKSDTQGHDLKIVAALPTHFWQRVDVALIEVTSVAAGADECERFLQVVADFPIRRSLKFGERELTLEKLRAFIAQANGSEMDVLLAR